MLSTEIEQFAKSVDAVMDDAITTANKDYKTRIEAISEIYNMPREILQLGNTTAAKLAEGGISEMQRVQREAKCAMESKIVEVDERLNSMKGIPEKASEVVYLTEKLSGWIGKFERISIPKGPHNSAFSLTAGTSMTNIQKKWELFCANDPVIKKAELYKEKQSVTERIEKLHSAIKGLEVKLPGLKTELQDRTTNAGKYESQVRQAVADETAAIDTELRHTAEDIADLETQERSYKSELSSTGFFALGKKKALKEKLRQLAVDIAGEKGKIPSIEERKKKTENSLSERITALGNKIDALKKEISDDEMNLESSKKELAESEAELVEINRKLEQ